MIKQIDAANLILELVKADEVCLVMFSSPLCQPCKALKPVIEEFAETCEVNCYEVDTTKESNFELVNHFRVQMVPTTFFCSPGCLSEDGDWKVTPLPKMFTVVQLIEEFTQLEERNER